MLIVALSLPLRFGSRPQSFLKNPTTTKRITAPMTALMIAATMPPTRTKPASGKSQPATKLDNHNLCSLHLACARSFCSDRCAPRVPESYKPWLHREPLGRHDLRAHGVLAPRLPSSHP